MKKTLLLLSFFTVNQLYASPMTLIGPQKAFGDFTNLPTEETEILEGSTITSWINTKGSDFSIRTNKPSPQGSPHSAVIGFRKAEKGGNQIALGQKLDYQLRENDYFKLSFYWLPAIGFTAKDKIRVNLFYTDSNSWIGKKTIVAQWEASSIQNGTWVHTSLPLTQGQNLSSISQERKNLFIEFKTTAENLDVSTGQFARIDNVSLVVHNKAKPAPAKPQLATRKKTHPMRPAKHTQLSKGNSQQNSEAASLLSFGGCTLVLIKD